MKIAIIGKGISGCAIAFYLIGHAKIDLYYSEPGASMAAAGMLHKFVGDTGRKSFMADQAFSENERIFETIKGEFCKKTSIKRKILSESMRQGFLSQNEDEITWLSDEEVLIKNGYLIDVPLYLDAVESYLKKHHVLFFQQKINHLDDLESYDAVIICAGYGIKELGLHLKMKYLKGQALVFKTLQKHNLPLIAKGYLAPFSDKVVVGSTYERKFEDEKPELETALKLLKDPLNLYFSPYDTQTPQKVLSGVRVAHPNFNHPKIIPHQKKHFFVTGLGSRGLLYHGLLGRLVKSLIIDGEKSEAFVL